MENKKKSRERNKAEPKGPLTQRRRPNSGVPKGGKKNRTMGLVGR